MPKNNWVKHNPDIEVFNCHSDLKR